jgi:hypothetical protein
MTEQGWRRMFPEPHPGTGLDCPIPAYSEFMPPPRIGWKPYGSREPMPFAPDDPFGWRIQEYEEEVELQPGLAALARTAVGALANLGQGRPARGISRALLAGNPYWPPELASRAGRLAQERYVILLPLALSRTQDDKGRVRWTLFGGSEQGPAAGFWKGFFLEPGRESPAAEGLAFIRQLLARVYGESAGSPEDLRAAGFRILPSGRRPAGLPWVEPDLPSWTAPFLWTGRESAGAVRYLLTFRPFQALPAAVRQAYLDGRLHLLPFPGSLVFWGARSILRLARSLPLAGQIPLLHLFERHEAPRGLRVLQSGWMHEHRPAPGDTDPGHEVVRNTYRRTHRWARVHRHEDELAVAGTEERIAHVLFSAAPEDIGLYGKPMARNVQIWTKEYKLLLDGPQAGRTGLRRAAEALRAGGHFGYRFLFPAMRVGCHEIYWHRPLAAWLSPVTGHGELLPDAPAGYLTGYPARPLRLNEPIELWPRRLRREPYRRAVEGYRRLHGHPAHQAAINVRKLLGAWQLLDERPLSRSFARHLLTLPKDGTLEKWLASLVRLSRNPRRGEELAGHLAERLAPPARRLARKLPEALTFHQTARRSFETAYWNTIARLATGGYVNKDNADCVEDPATRARLRHYRRDLDSLGDFLLESHRQAIARSGMTGRALAGDLPFRWRTDFEYPWMGGWRRNQTGALEERDLLVVIPGRDRSRAVILADHYDTAYMEDCYWPERGGDGARLAAAGADDNHSATATLLLAAPIFLEMSRSGQLEYDIWLVHLTGEEFPSDCLGARHLACLLVEGRLALRLPGQAPVDLSAVRVEGVYVMDMIAHNRDRERDIFQIAPGTSRQSLALAGQAHLANMAWNARVPGWNRRPARRGLGRGRRSRDGRSIPAMAAHLPLQGEIRPVLDPRSALYNTDGQILSDAGIPVVLFMENYDISRQGYHDTHDTMENIDLDYGSALAAIAIESTARVAAGLPGIG